MQRKRAWAHSAVPAFAGGRLRVLSRYLIAVIFLPESLRLPRGNYPR